MSWTAPITWEALVPLLAAQLNQEVRDNLNFLKTNIALEIAAGLTIDTGIVTKTQTHHVIAAESGIADDLETINAGAEGEVLLLRADTGDTITLKHDIDNLYNPLGEDVDITDSSYAILIHNGTNWIIFASGLSVAGIQDLIDASMAAIIIDEDDMVSNSDTRVPTQQSTKAYADALIAANDAMVIKGAIDCSGNPNYPAADCGHTYKISVAGKIGGASGVTVEAGDTAICTVDNSALGDQATVGANWVVLQTNINTSTLVLKSLYDADSVLTATTDDIPVATTMAEQTVLGRLTSGHPDDIAIGIADNNIVQVDQADVADNDIAKWTANGLEGRSYSELLSDIGVEAGATKYPDTGEQAFLDADHTKLDGIEAAADVTDATNVAAAGALMASVLTERGSIIFRNATVPAELLHGTDGQVLTTKGDGADPIWAAGGGGGTVSRAMAYMIAQGG